MLNLYSYLSKVFTIIDKDKNKLPFILSFFLFQSFLDILSIGLIAPYVSILTNPEAFINNTYYNYFLEEYFSQSQNNLLNFFGITLILIFLLKSIFSIFIEYLIISFSSFQLMNVRANLMRSYQMMPYDVFIKRNSSEYIRNITLAEKFTGATVQSGLRLVSNLIVTFMILMLLAYRDIFALSILLFLILIIVILYDFSFRSKLLRYGKIVNIKLGEVIQTLNENINGFKELKILKKQNNFYFKLYNASKLYAQTNIKSTLILSIPRYIIEFMLILFVVFFVMITINFSNNINELIPTLTMFGLASVRLGPAANQIIIGISQLRSGYDTVEVLYDDVRNNKKFMKMNFDNSTVSNNDFKSLELKNLTFCYDNQKKPVLSDISFKINRGDIVGFIGPSGSGKTTLIDTLLGLLIPKSGKIIVNEKNINQDNINFWQSQIAYLPQEIFLIDDSIKNNIALGVDNVNLNKLNIALKNAKLDEFVKSLPSGLDTSIGDKGVKISGGQKQRIALARAFYFNRNILILDESTSALDSENESAIVEEINKIPKDKTIIIIAHRLSTLKYCDYIYTLKDGRVIKKSLYSEIINKNPL